MSLEFELVLPCYNEARSLPLIIQRTLDAAQLNGFSSDTFRLILVENGSRDNSREVLADLQHQPAIEPWVGVVWLESNQGYGNGLWQGLQATTAPVVGWSHADEQCDPKDAFKAYALWQSLKAENILIKGVRLGRSRKEIMVSRVFEFIASFSLGRPFFEINAQPKVFPRRLLELCPSPPFDFAFDLYVLYCALKNGFQIHTFPVQFAPRVHGFSNWAYGLKNRFRHITNMLGYIRKLARHSGRLGPP